MSIGEFWTISVMRSSSKPELNRTMRFNCRKHGFFDYVCCKCVTDGVSEELCKSPEWDPTDRAFDNKVPEKVIEWMARHAGNHVIAERNAERLNRQRIREEQNRG